MSSGFLVIGVGGGGCNAVRTLSTTIKEVDFVCIDTDEKSLYAGEYSNIQYILLSEKSSSGYGTAANPTAGAQALEKHEGQIKEILNRAQIVCIVAAMGGGTGTGASPRIAELAREKNLPTIAIVCKPFSFLSGLEIVESGIQAIKKHSDAVIPIENDIMLLEKHSEMNLEEGLNIAMNRAVLDVINGLSEILNNPGTINVDFADVKTVLSSSGEAIFTQGEGTGDNCTSDAIDMALENLSFSKNRLLGAENLLVCLTVGSKFSIKKFKSFGMEIIKLFDQQNTKIISGTSIIENMHEKECKVTIFATGIDINNKYVNTEKNRKINT